jgi:hypothetical protein
MTTEKETGPEGEAPKQVAEHVLSGSRSGRKHIITSLIVYSFGRVHGSGDLSNYIYDAIMSDLDTRKEHELEALYTQILTLKDQGRL